MCGQGQNEPLVVFGIKSYVLWKIPTEVIMKTIARRCLIIIGVFVFGIVSARANSDSLVAPFKVGEKLEFGIYYQFIRVGTAVMEVMDTVEVNGQPAIHIQTRARSSSFFDSFYRVRDEVNTYVHPQYFHSLRFTKRLREGSYFFDLNVDYNYSDSLTTGEKIRYHEDDEKRIRKRENFEFKMTDPLYDILASFYFTRLHELETGQPISVNSNDNDKVYPLKVFVQREEKIDTDAGEFRTLQIVPKIRGESIFKQKGTMWIWLTDDKYKIPVKLKTELPFGSITVELEKIKGIKGPIPSQID
jgi:hypothetical protein